jgi:hypothetical protein
VNILGIIASSTLAAAGDFESIATVSVGGGGASSVDFTSIAATYSHLQIRHLNSAGSSSGTDSLLLRFNSDTGSNYTYHVIYGNGSSALASAASSQTSAAVSQVSLSSTIFAGGVIDILDYANTSKYKTVRGFSGVDFNGSGVIALESSVWMNTAAITSINIRRNSVNLNQYSTFALYGIKGA